jgi:hypothetical protein
MKDIIDFFDTSIIWSPLYVVAIVFICNYWAVTYGKLRETRRENKSLKSENNMLLQRLERIINF